MKEAPDLLEEILKFQTQGITSNPGMERMTVSMIREELDKRGHSVEGSRETLARRLEKARRGT